MFPQTKAPLRTDEGFRAGMYIGHYREQDNKRIQSPLLRLQINMVLDIITSDSLHLLHLGIMKRLIVSYKDGHNDCDNMKWPERQVRLISAVLTEQKMPCEIHRAVRGIDTICHWKASECATFLNYLGVGLLKLFLIDDHYKMFLNLFCAVTICSTEYYRHFLPAAQGLFDEFIKQHYKLFKSATSNVHNTTHIAAECERFGTLPSLSAYPFENHLFEIKKLLRSGKLPLPQISNRLTEMAYRNENSAECPPKLNYPILTKAMKADPNKFLNVQLRDGCLLKVDNANKWFLTKKKEIVGMKYVQKTGIIGVQLKRFRNAF